MTRLRLQWLLLAMALPVCICLGAFSAFGQATNTGTVVGVVTDQSGAVIPGAAVNLTDLTTGAVRTTVTNGAGEYVMVNVPPGKYDITVIKTGFSTDKAEGQTVSVGSQTTANFKLTVGAAQQTIEVQESGVELQTLNATIGATVAPVAIDSLPALGRDVSTFATLQPGVSPEGSVAGTVVDQTVFQLDGGSNTNDMDGSMNVYTPSFAGNPTGIGGIGSGASGVMPTPADSVEEFKVNTANQTADFDNSSGSQIEVVTKRGTNKWHGTVYEYYLDNKLDANTWDNNLSGTPIPDYHYNRFGAAGGGPLISKNILGGKTYFFANYEGFRYPNSATFEQAVPSAAMQAGMLTFTANNVTTTYNLNTMDPRGIGINPTVQAMWAKYEPAGNDPSCGTIKGTRCDGVNEIGYKSNVSIPQKSNFGVARLDHDFGSRWHWMTSYRYYNLTLANTSQVDIGGFFAGDTKGVAASLSQRPQVPWYFVTQLTTTISSGVTNDFHYSFLRNYWSWSDKNAPPQITGLGGVLEPLGESATVLAPFNVNSQNIRTRFWDGHDNFLRDDVTMLKGNHLFTFGGQYQRNWDYHQRSDNGGGINFTTTYQLGDSAGSGQVALSGLQAAGYPSGTTQSRDAAAVLGIVTDSQVAYTRTGSNLSLNPPLTPASDKSTIPYYNVYFSDAWHLRPNLTLTYGMGWTLEMPPTEAQGKQVELVDDADQQLDGIAYLAQRKAAALEGNVYNPTLGFALVGNVGKGLKYPYQPFYGSFSPRLAAAWNPHFEHGSVIGHIFGEDATVIRGGYGRIYGRLNGVDQVLVPLLGTGLIQAVQCTKPLANGSCGPASPTDTSAFRIGVDGTTAPLAAAAATLPQPIYPGYNAVASAASEALDPHFRPNDVDSFDLTIQRRINSKTLLEVGYIGRLIHHEYQPVNLNAVPYMMSSGGQSFEAAYAQIETAMGCVKSYATCGINGTPTVSPQPFFESSLAASGYCQGYSSCTAAVLANEFGNFQNQAVWNIWSDLDNGAFNFPRTMMNTPIAGQVNGTSGQSSSGIADNASIGYGNYNAGFITVSTSDWHGLTVQENLTYSKALGTGGVVQASSEYTPNDPFDLRKMYGVQNYNHKYIFNTFAVWQTPWYSGQNGLIGRLAGGWTFAPVFSSGSGAPLYCNTTTDGQSFGAGDGINYFDNEQCVFTTRYTGGYHTHSGVTGSTDPYGNSVGTNIAVSGSGVAKPINMFKNPAAVYDQMRAPILGIDNINPGQGAIPGLPYWNLDMSTKKDIRVTEGVNFEFSFVVTNLLNHVVFQNPYQQINDPGDFGVITTQSPNGNNPRQMQFGFRISY